MNIFFKKTVSMLPLLVLVKCSLGTEKGKIHSAEEMAEPTAPSIDSLEKIKNPLATHAPVLQPIDLDTFNWVNVQEVPDLEVENFFKDQCQSCHGFTSEIPNPPLGFLWKYDAENTLKYLKNMETSSRAYATMFSNIVDYSGPKPMPPREQSESERSVHLSILKWFQVNIPHAVTNAQTQFATPSHGNESENMTTYQCEEKITLTEFLPRLTFAAFDRPPTSSEWSEFTSTQKEQTVTRETQNLITSWFEEEVYLNEFMDTGLKKLANTISGAAGIDGTQSFTRNTIEDLKQEFYQPLKSSFLTNRYDRIYSTRKLPVTRNTAQLYDCAPPHDDWSDCILPATRGSFFSSVSFLNTIPSSFLIENNNYGRVARMFFVLFGEGPSPSTNGPTGNDDAYIPPECIDSLDPCYEKEAPRGTISIPQFGSYCRSCHIGRHLAAGSILFRPFSSSGFLYTPENFASIDQNYFQSSIQPEWTYRFSGSSHSVDEAFLGSLLTQSNLKSCMRVGGQYYNVRNLVDFTTALTADKHAVYRGLSRHLHRAFAESMTTNEEVLNLYSSPETQSHPLKKLVKKYFNSETFACKREVNP